MEATRDPEQHPTEPRGPLEAIDAEVPGAAKAWMTSDEVEAILVVGDAMCFADGPEPIGCL
jgi:hypothetical protein